MEPTKRFMITRALSFGAFGAFEYSNVFFLLLALAFLERGLMLATLALSLGIKLLRGFTDYQFSTAQVVSSLFSFLSLKVFFTTLGVYSLFMITSGFVTALLTKAGLEIYDSRWVTFNNLFIGWRRLLNLIAGMFLYGTLCLVGFFCLIVPGIILSLTYGYYRHFIIDRNMRPLEAFQASAHMTRGARGEILTMQALLSFLNLIGFYWWGLGLFLTLPLSLLANIYVYRQLVPDVSKRP